MTTSESALARAADQAAHAAFGGLGGDYPSYEIPDADDPDARAHIYGERFRTAGLVHTRPVSEYDDSDYYTVVEYFLVAADVADRGEPAIHTALRDATLAFARGEDPQYVADLIHNVSDIANEVPNRYLHATGVVPAYRPSIGAVALELGYDELPEGIDTALETLATTADQHDPAPQP